MSYRGPRLKNPCILCGEREGTIKTSDGLVCGACMPRDLLAYAPRKRRGDIEYYKRSHPTWVSCEAPAAAYDREKVSPDRSMAITGADPVILADEYNSQMGTAEGIDILVSFIKCSGLNLLIDSLREFSRRGRLRVITTTYMGATEWQAISDLLSLPNAEVRMELDAGEESLHAKCILFRRPGGDSTAYVGSANFSQRALTSGEEWVVKVREQDGPDVVRDVERGYEALWDSGRYKKITKADRAKVEAALSR